ncbi:hypothetical protein V5799_031229 [Amblyomma americanum]|uniref:ZZ-type zinc finger-containing protein 3 n=1 Tax=Amblyomma americanum TaxID=6943 RepID=A0AAQ4EL02_AMBAM
MEAGSEEQPAVTATQRDPTLDNSQDRQDHDTKNGDCSPQTATNALDGPSTRDGGVQEQSGEDLDDIGEFFFESDHLALRGNSDYRNALKTLAVLEAQRVQVVQDIEKLIEVRDEALEDPIRFVERLQKKEDLGIPVPQLVAPIPNIDWSEYSLMGIQRGIEGKRQFTRHAAKTEPKGAETSQAQGQGSSGINGGNILIRGRVFSENKPATFNQLWTAEEQKRLEELLLKFPPEEIESRRWEKIASALGNRTPTQVASRVQKYFIKLAKAGLPVPGRIPNVTAPRKIGTGHTRRGYHHHHGSQKSSTYLFSQSTFFASHRPPVFMNDADDDSCSSSWGHLESSNSGSQGKSEARPGNEDDADLDAAVKESAEYQELLALRKVREERMKRTGLAQHVGFRCDRCECAPIMGTRWHCTDCPTGTSIDFCNDCVDCMHETATHKDDHHLEPIRVAQDCSTFHDRDYMSFTGADYNYLDPNYLPGSS